MQYPPLLLLLQEQQYHLQYPPLVLLLHQLPRPEGILCQQPNLLGHGVMLHTYNNLHLAVRVRVGWRV